MVTGAGRRAPPIEMPRLPPRHVRGLKGPHQDSVVAYIVRQLRVTLGPTDDRRLVSCGMFLLGLHFGAATNGIRNHHRACADPDHRHDLRSQAIKCS